jgi:hypothetical protein
VSSPCSLLDFRLLVHLQPAHALLPRAHPPQAAWKAVADASDAFVAKYASRKGARKTVEWALNEFKKDKTDREKAYVNVNANADDTYVQEFGAE